jgi:hypothetical protein
LTLHAGRPSSAAAFDRYRGFEKRKSATVVTSSCRSANTVGRVVGLALVLTLAQTNPARACAAAPPTGQHVETQREDAIIVWDEARHVEHFIRNAVFGTSATSFGFLVPTPTRPVLAEASDQAAGAIGSVTRPPIVHEMRFSTFPIGCTMLPFVFRTRSVASAPQMGASSPVTVLEQTRVAGLDAVILKADDSGALADWLTAHGFEFRDALKRWVSPYLAKSWTITAFRYARASSPAVGAAAEDRLGSRTVRMTFAADAPVYPYREPDDAPATMGRGLHLFVVATSKLDGLLAEASDRPWSAAVPFSAAASLPQLSELLPGIELPSRLWISEFWDGVSRRETSDLVFRPSKTQTEVRPPPEVVLDVVNVPVPYEAPFVVAGIWWYRRRRRARRNQSTR